MTVARWEQPALTPSSGRDVVDGWAHQLAGVAKLADYIAATDFVPTAYRGQPAAVAAAILAGRELGIGPMTALQHLHVIEGRPAMSAQLMRALVLAAGHQLRIVEATTTRCTIAGTRKGGTEAAVTWTMDDAKRAGLAGRPSWSRYPRQLLLARATGELCRGIFPDVIGGMAYTVEEIADLDAETSSGWAPIEPAPARTVARAPRQPARGKGNSTLPAAPSPVQTPPAVEDVQAPPPPPPEEPPLPDELEHTEPTQADPQDDDKGDELLTGGQRAHLFALLTAQRRMEPRELRLRTVSALVGRPLHSIAQVSKTEASALIDTLVRIVASPDGDAQLDWLVQQGQAALEDTTDQLTFDQETPDA